MQQFSFFDAYKESATFVSSSGWPRDHLDRRRCKRRIKRSDKGGLRVDRIDRRLELDSGDGIEKQSKHGEDFLGAAG